MTGPELDRFAPLTGWLADRIGGERHPVVVSLRAARAASSGFSADTTVLDVAVSSAGGPPSPERYVVRTESPEPPIYPVQVPGWEVEIELQYRVMEALGRTGRVPLAELIGYEPDPAVLGAPFFVMRHVDGVVPVENPPYTVEGFFTALAPDARSRMIDNGLAVLARLHTVDWRAAGLDFLVPAGVTPGLARQLDLWEGYAATELRDRRLPLLERAFAWLHAHPPGPSPVGFCWGDPRPGNVIWHDCECRCVTDFEAASIAPPELDLGWWLMFDVTMHEGVGVERLPGDPSRAEQLAMYEQHARRAVPGIRWWEVCAAARYCAIVVRVMNRAVDRGLMPADHVIWRENPAVSALELLLDGD